MNSEGLNFLGDFRWHTLDWSATLGSKLSSRIITLSNTRWLETSMIIIGCCLSFLRNHEFCELWTYPVWSDCCQVLLQKVTTRSQVVVDLSWLEATSGNEVSDTDRLWMMGLSAWEYVPAYPIASSMPSFPPLVHLLSWFILIMFLVITII